MKINILDAGLVDKGGHHFDIDRNVVRYLVEAGHDVRVYAYVGAIDEVKEIIGAYAPVEAVFRSFHYATPEDADFYAGELTRFLRDAEKLAEDLQHVRPADLWFWPTMSAQHLLACARVMPDAGVVGCIHEDPGIATRSVGAQMWRYALLEAHRKKLRFTAGSVEPELRFRYMEIMPDARFIVFPHPFDGTPIEQPKRELKKIGFFGHQRPEKGTNVIGRVIGQLVTDGYDILFQDSWGLLKMRDHPQIEALDFVDDLTGPLKACDLVVLPYEVERYRAHGSGILAHCLILGIPVVGPFGTIPGRLIEQFRVGPLFQRTEGRSIHAAIKQAEANYARYAANAFNLSRQYSKQNGVAHFAAAALRFA